MSVKRYECGMTNAPTEYQSPTMHQDADGGYIAFEDYAALEARCAALAAEVSAVLTDRAVILEDLDNTCFEIGMQRGEKVDAYPTPTVANHDAFLAEVRAQARNEGINYAASRLTAAFNHGFVDKPLAEVFDVVRMILDAKEELANSTLPAADGLSGEYAEKFLTEFAGYARKGVQS